jgi:hypothetical protein
MARVRQKHLRVVDVVRARRLAGMNRDNETRECGVVTKSEAASARQPRRSRASLQPAESLNQKLSAAFRESTAATRSSAVQVRRRQGERSACDLADSVGDDASATPGRAASVRCGVAHRAAVAHYLGAVRRRCRGVSQQQAHVDAEDRPCEIGASGGLRRRCRRQPAPQSREPPASCHSFSRSQQSHSRSRRAIPEADARERRLTPFTTATPNLQLKHPESDSGSGLPTELGRRRTPAL